MGNSRNNAENTQDDAVVIESGRDTIGNVVGDGATVTTTTFNAPINAGSMEFRDGGVWIDGKRVG